MAARWGTGEPFNWALLCRSPCCDATRAGRNVEEKCVTAAWERFVARLFCRLAVAAQIFTGLICRSDVAGVRRRANSGGGTAFRGVLFRRRSLSLGVVERFGSGWLRPLSYAVVCLGRASAFWDSGSVR